MADRVIRFGSRKSALAVAQTKIIMDAVTAAHPDISAKFVPMETTGDRNMKPFSDVSDKFGIKGLFTLELEEALLSGKIDVAVHSLKDVPMNANPELPIVAYSKREDPRDALVLPNGASELRGGVIGCSSSRRAAQLSTLFPGMKIASVRGNVNTRLHKLDCGEFSALILAAAGLKRIGLRERISRYFGTDEIVPAPGQGIMACQGRAGGDYSWLDAASDENSALCAKAERTFSAVLGGGCTAPIGAYAEIENGIIKISGFSADEKTGKIFKSSAQGSAEKGEEIAAALARGILRGELQ